MRADGLIPELEHAARLKAQAMQHARADKPMMLGSFWWFHAIETIARKQATEILKTRGYAKQFGFMRDGSARRIVALKAGVIELFEHTFDPCLAMRGIVERITISIGSYTSASCLDAQRDGISA